MRDCSLSLVNFPASFSEVDSLSASPSCLLLIPSQPLVHFRCDLEGPTFCRSFSPLSRAPCPHLLPIPQEGASLFRREPERPTPIRCPPLPSHPAFECESSAFPGPLPLTLASSSYCPAAPNFEPRERKRAQAANCPSILRPGNS